MYSTKDAVTAKADSILGCIPGTDHPIEPKYVEVIPPKQAQSQPLVKDKVQFSVTKMGTVEHELIPKDMTTAAILPDFLTKHQLCGILNISLSTLNRLLAQKEIPFLRMRNFTGTGYRILFSKPANSILKDAIGYYLQ